jgi:hypothetical protein
VPESPPLQATFFLDGESGEQLDALSRLDPDRDWRELQRGERAWVLQTYLHLTRAGYPALLAGAAPEAGLVLFHAKQRRALLAQVGRWRGRALAAIRGDLHPVWAADFEVVQNAHSARGRRQIFMPHWPQPGLLSRDPARGSRIARIAYKGFDKNLHPYFRSAEWRAYLAAHGIEWVADSVPFAERGTRGDLLEWPDFRTVDLILAVRPAGGGRGAAKPATKLCNAWLAGVPALLSPDIAFEELRRSPLDYLAVSGPEDARAAVRRLIEEPGLYAQMVENGRRRSVDFTVEAVRRRWIELLDETLPQRLAEPGAALRRLPARLAAWPHRLAGRRPDLGRHQGW